MRKLAVSVTGPVTVKVRLRPVEATAPGPIPVQERKLRLRNWQDACGQLKFWNGIGAKEVERTVPFSYHAVPNVPDSL